VQDAGDLGGDLFAAPDLAEDADLHVVNQQRHFLRVANLFQCSGDVQAVGMFHRVSL
jgi:hypothetical protein